MGLLVLSLYWFFLHFPITMRLRLRPRISVGYEYLIIGVVLCKYIFMLFLPYVSSVSFQGPWDLDSD